MKKIMLNVTVLFVSLFSFIDKTFAHNGVEEHSNKIDLSSEWNFLLAGLLVIVYVFFRIQLKKEQGFFKKSFFFFLSLLVFFIAFGSPLHVLGDHYLFSAHKLEQSLMYLVLPPLLLLSLPDRLAKSFFSFRLKYKLISLLKKPLVPLLLFNVLFSFYHIPLIFNAVVSNNFLHNLTHIVLTITALFMWIPLIPTIKELDHLTDIQKIGYIFGAGISLTPACALIIFSDTPFYSVYNNTSQLFSYLPPLEDQQTGGIIMKVVQELVYGTIQ